MRRKRQRPYGNRRKLQGIAGVDFVRCRICDDHRRVISGRHLSKHETDRETYMEEYDLSPDKLIAVDFRRIQSSLPGYHAFGRKEWLTEIKKFYKRNGKVSARLLQKKKPQLYHQGAWLFGSWDNALRAAGFTPEKVRLHKVWDREKVIEAIRELRDQNRQLNAHYANKNYTSLFTAGVRYYGDWGRALAAAGMSNIPTLTNATARRELLKRLRKTSGNSRGTLSKSLRLQAELYFGSLRNALKKSTIG